MTADLPSSDRQTARDLAHDRGLGTAYERYCFYQRLDTWATRYGIGSMLEGPVDGMAGVAGVHGVGLARRGVKIVSILPDEEKAAAARAIYANNAGGGSNVDVRVLAEPDGLAELPPADLVLAYHALTMVGDWRAYLRSLAKLARRILIVTVCNPQNWGVELIRLAAKARNLRGLDPPSVWRTETLAPVLAELGSVREHVFFDCPWWPDLQVSPGQSLLDRARQLLWQRRSHVEFTARAEGARLAERFVYGAERWPYFGGGAWAEELLPALLRHPGFDGAETKLLRRLAHLHAFVIDTSVRSART